MRRLPTVKLEGKKYFVDERLRQLRNVDNPHDFISLEDAYKKDEKKMSKYYGHEVRVYLVKEEKAIQYFIHKSNDAYALVKDVLDWSDREIFLVIALNASNQVLGVNEVSVGNISQSIVTPREIFKPLILQNAKSMILAHNHPSGNTQPSLEDRKVTDILKDLGNKMDIQLLDHIIVGNGFLSFSDESLL